MDTVERADMREHRPRAEQSRSEDQTDRPGNNQAGDRDDDSKPRRRWAPDYPGNRGRPHDRQRAVDPRATTQTNIDQATAQLQSNAAQVKSAEAQVQIASLVQQTIQAAEDTVTQRVAQVEQAKANLATAEINLSYTDLLAPQDGRITRRNVDLGTFVQAGQQVFYIVTPQVWVTANFKETQLADMRPGQHVAMDVDAYPNLRLHGHVDSIQDGSGARFSAFPAENANGQFRKDRSPRAGENHHRQWV